MTPDLVRTVMGWLGGLAFAAAAVGAIYLTGKVNGRNAERAVWQEKMLVAERAARQTEADLNGIAARSAKRFAEKERLLNERALKQDEQWRALLASLPRYRVPRAVGVQLNAAASVPAAAAVAGALEAPAAADDPGIELGETLDACYRNNAIGVRNIGTLIEARDWYEAVRARVNAGEQP